MQALAQQLAVARKSNGPQDSIPKARDDKTVDDRLTPLHLIGTLVMASSSKDTTDRHGL